MNKDAAISFRLDEKMIAELDRLADLQGKARTAIIREAIAKHLKVPPPKAQSDSSKLDPQDGYRARIDAVEAELGELKCLISDLYRLHDQSVECSSVIETAIHKFVVE
jgi:predicted transcriptional regulator